MHLNRRVRTEVALVTIATAELDTASVLFGFVFGWNVDKNKFYYSVIYLHVTSIWQKYILFKEVDNLKCKLAFDWLYKKRRKTKSENYSQEVI